MKLPLEPSDRLFALSSSKAFVKRTFDLVVALVLLPVLGPLAIVMIVAARLSTGQSGIFRQERVGLFGESFTLLKIRSMKSIERLSTNVTTSNDPRITKFGALLRKSKLDEVPQVLNVLRGDMSFVGPRPDVAEMFEELSEDTKKVLCIRPGITGPASVLFRDEEFILQAQENPEKYNREVIFPQKVEANLLYIKEQSLVGDIIIMINTVFR